MAFFKILNLFFFVLFSGLVFTLKFHTAQARIFEYKKIAFNEKKEENFTTSAQNQEDQGVLSIVFDDELIQGEAKNPDTLFILNDDTGVLEEKKILKLRSNFLPEMRETAKRFF